MEQLPLVFDAEPDPYEPVCTFGAPTINSGYAGPGHCPECHAYAEELRLGFDADVRAGKYDAHGYTKADRIAQRARLDALR